jgi:hypothetical protein
MKFENENTKICCKLWWIGFETLKTTKLDIKKKQRTLLAKLTTSGKKKWYVEVNLKKETTTPHVSEGPWTSYPFHAVGTLSYLCGRRTPSHGLIDLCLSVFFSCQAPALACRLTASHPSPLPVPRNRLTLPPFLCSVATRPRGHGFCPSPSSPCGHGWAPRGACPAGRGCDYVCSYPGATGLHPVCRRRRFRYWDVLAAL